MTDEILLLMNERRKHKNKTDSNIYEDIQRLIRSKIRIAKNEWLHRKCSEIEQLQNQHADFKLHKKLKESAGIYKKIRPTITVNNNNQIVLETKEKINVWEKYIEELFDDDRPPAGINHYLTGPSITKDEIENAIQNSKNKKAAGPDGIPSEIFKLLDERGITSLHRVFNTIYYMRQVTTPKQWLCSTFIPLPNKTNARKCEDHRLISLMSHTLKIFLKIIHQRIYKKCERGISDSQFEFRQGLGTREAIVVTQLLAQNCYGQRNNLCHLFHRLRKSI